MTQWRWIGICALGVGLLMVAGVSQQAFAPYHNPPPPPPPPPQQSQAASSVVVLAASVNLVQETEPSAAGTPETALGAAAFLFDPSNNTLKFALAYGGLSGPALASHFHNAPAGANGGVLQTICGGPGELVGPCPATTTNGFLQGTWIVPADKVEALLNGEVYINLHTEKNPAGEIRGQIVRSK